MFLNAFLLALREIRRNLMRSILTMLGIIIGVAAVITMVTLGNGATAQVTAQISSLGSNLLMIRPGQRGPNRNALTVKRFQESDATAILREVNSVVAVAPTDNASTTVVYGNKNWTTSIVGTTNDYFITGNWELKQGREFTEKEIKSGKSTCIIGQTIVKELLEDEDPIGKKLRLSSFSCDIVGVLDSKGQSMMGNDQDDMIVIPLKTLQRRITGNSDVAMIRVSVKPNIDTNVVNRAITLLLRERRHLSDNQKNDFSVMDTSQITETLTSTTKVMTMLLGAVAAVSLVVGGIGIMNIMLVSVIERTREIGIRLAIGALEKEVLWQFLVEAITLSSLGGIIGIIFALITSAIVSDIMAIPLIFDMNIIVLAFLFSAAVGVVFGYLPARNAARLNPIDALRHE